MRTAGVLLLLAVCLLLPSAAGAEPSLHLEHRVTQVTSDAAGTRTADCTLRVRAGGDTPVHGLRLALVTLFTNTTEDVLLEIGDVAAGAVVDAPFRLVDLEGNGESPQVHMQLFWNGWCLDELGNEVEFPAESIVVEEDLP